VVIFSDGDDRDSLVGRERAMARVQASDAVVYTIGFGAGSTLAGLRQGLEQYAAATGGRAFFPRNVSELDDVFDAVVVELANQYMLSYSPLNTARDGKWRSINVRVRKGKYSIRARAGYRFESQLAER
jgi:VWFA-related protein